MKDLLSLHAADNTQSNFNFECKNLTKMRMRKI